MADPEETEILPGVFLTDFRQTPSTTKSAQSESLMAGFQGCHVLELLNADISEITEQIFHLKRSNTELLEEIKTDPDPEFKLAVEENLHVIIKKKKRLEELEQLRKEAIEELTNQVTNLEQLAPPDTEEDYNDGELNMGQETKETVQIPDDDEEGIYL